jgi:hypothetical protein
MRRLNEVTAHYARRFTNALIAMILVASAGTSTLRANSIYQTGPFRSLCSSVEISAEPEIFQRFARATVNENVARTIEARLRTLGLNYPVLAGAECLRERASAPRQLSLLFYARAVSDPEHPRRLVISLIMHSYYNDPKSPGPYHTDIPRAQHEFPTEVSFCSAEADASRCLTDRVINYFDATMLKIIEANQGPLKGGRQ